MENPYLWGIAFVVLGVWLFLRSLTARRVHAEQERRLQLIAERRSGLLLKYQDEATVDAIMNSQVWQGMSEDQLIDSRGYPEDKATRIFKTKTVETFKYDRVGRGRFATKVIVENGFVVGWETK